MSLKNPWSKFWLSILILKMQKVYVLWVQIWGLGGCWSFLTEVWHLDLDMDKVTGLWNTHVPNFGSLSWFWRCKEHPCPLSPHLGLWRMLEVPDWDLESLSWVGCGHPSLIYQYWLAGGWSLILAEPDRPNPPGDSIFSKLNWADIWPQT